ncbi:MAG: NACHT domain-containing protein [Anaerolineae bacterium]|nr:NACHT domain-containing protein [Anaerolineae bacterium]
MAFDLKTWKQQAAEKLSNSGDWLRARMKRDAPYVAYGALCSLSLWPLLQAAQTDFSAVAVALANLGANAGLNLVANNFQKWKDEADVANGIAAAAQNDAALRADLDKILAEVQAAQHAQASQRDREQAIFLDELRQVLEQVGSTLTINTGGGAVVQNSNLEIGHDFVGRDQFIIENYVVQVIQKSEGESEIGLLELVREYLDDTMQRCTKMKWDAIADSFVQHGGAPPELADIFVPLDVQFTLPEGVSTLADFALLRGHDDAKRGRTSGRTRPDRDDGDDVIAVPNLRGSDEPAKRVTALDVLGAYPRAVLLGKPGSGKTTLAAYVVLHLARAASGDSGALKALGEAWTHGALMPVQIILRRLAESLPDNCQRGQASHVWDFLRQHAGLTEQERLVNVLRRIARKQGALFVFDGLDECGSETRQARVHEAIQDFMDTAGEQCRFLITARPYAWGTPQPKQGEHLLADLTPDQVQRFVQQWFERLHDKGWFDADERDDKLRRLREFVQRNEVRESKPEDVVISVERRGRHLLVRRARQGRADVL